VPNWQPNWEDVRWNWAAADAAAAELDRNADQLESNAGVWQQAAAAAALEWRGTFRSRFDSEGTDILRDAWYQAAEFRAEAASIRRASQMAREEQARRERDRARWRAEKAAEDAAAARARARRQQQAQQAANGG
jgi:hypothetical protein